MPTFQHDFQPPSGTLLGATVDLATREIEDAGLREVLQAPGASLGTWSILNALLEPCGEFRFREPLGKSREVKTALSGLFGRFVARAYAERYLRFTNFAHIHSPPMLLDARRDAEVLRVRGCRGDLPDWVAWAPRKLAIIEAKGCHDNKGPQTRLGKAYEQAERAEIRVGGRLARFRRYAIATRWGIGGPKPTESMLHVRDPDNDAEDVTPAELDAVGIGVVRRHIAALMKPLGQSELSGALLELTRVSFKNKIADAERSARTALDKAVVQEALSEAGRGPIEGLVGGMVTRGGPLLDVGKLSPADQETLLRLHLRPIFVGIERSTVEAAIKGDVEMMEQNFVRETVAVSPGSESGPTSDSGGVWVIRLEEDRTRLS